MATPHQLPAAFRYRADKILHPTESGGGALLYEAAAAGNLVLINALIAVRISASYADEQSNTALHHAAMGKHAPACKRLLQHSKVDGALDAEATNDKGVSSWEIALQSGDSKVCCSLMTHPLTCSLTFSRTRSLNSLIHSLAHLLIHLRTHGSLLTMYYSRP